MQAGKPVAYASRALTTTEQNYAQIEKELLAIVFGMERFHHYAYGRPVSIETDDKPLETIFKKHLQKTPKRLQRMLLRLPRYDITATYKRGTQMFVVDTLSRAYLPTDKGPSSSHLEVVHQQTNVAIEIEHINMADYIPLTQEAIAQIQEQTAKDPTLQQLKLIILQGWSNKNKLSPDLLPYYSYRDELVVQHNIIYRDDRCVLPRSMRANTLQKIRIHSSHLGIVGCQRRARECIF